MKIFLAGSQPGEFGWTISTWIPALRYKAKKCDRTVVLCPWEYRSLYEFADDAIHYPIIGKPDRWLLDGNAIKMPRLIVERYQGAEMWTPNENTCLHKPRTYYKYGENVKDELRYDVVIHARAVKVYKSGDRNWPIRKYEKLLDVLGPHKVCCVGTKNGAHYIPKTNDLRGIEMGLLCDVLASSKVCVGTSSGVMHLASHCGCPHVVFTYDKKLKVLGYKTNRQRYEKLWNPFKTPCSIIDKWGWRPPVDEVVPRVRKYL